MKTVYSIQEERGMSHPIRAICTNKMEIHKYLSRYTHLRERTTGRSIQSYSNFIRMAKGLHELNVRGTEDHFDYDFIIRAIEVNKPV